MPVMLSVSWAADLDRFRLLRESLRGFGATDEFPHVLVLHTEDMELVADLAHDRTLEIIPTATVLNKRHERRRVAARSSRAELRRWVPGGPLPGWYAQQLAKLGAAAGLGEPVLVLDSDLVLVSPLSRDDFMRRDGSVRFFVNDDRRRDASADWNETAERFLGVDPADAFRQYIHHPAAWDPAILRDLLTHVSHRHRMPWQRAFAEANVFEYSAYGVWATSLGTAEDSPLPILNFSYWHQMLDFSRTLATALDTGGCRFVGVQSRLHVPPEEYADLLRVAWRTR